MIPGSALEFRPYFAQLQGPLASPLERNIMFREFFLRFCGKLYNCANFQLPRPSGSACEFFPMLNLWQVEGSLDPPLKGNFRFRIFPFGLVVNPMIMQNFYFLGHLEVPEHFRAHTHKRTNIHSLLYI